MSAFQFRFKGFKGMLSVDPEAPSKTIRLRPSMEKFASPETHMEVLTLIALTHGGVILSP